MRPGAELWHPVRGAGGCRYRRGYAHPGGLALGPSLAALVTDYVFADPNAVGQSLAIVGTAVAALGIALVARGLAPFRALLASAQRAESPDKH